MDAALPAPWRRQTLGVILAGGQGLRMGGGDKPLRLLGGRPLLDHAVARLRPQVAALLLNANGDAGRFAAWGLPVAPDAPPSQGPLSGVLAALDWAAARHPELPWVASVPGDTPFIPPDLVDRLHAAREAAGHDLACAASAGRWHPPVAVWPVALRHELRAALSRGEGGIRRWAEPLGLAVAEWPARPRDPFFNCNTPAELAEAEVLLRS
ncbi:molybdenum cofactor guanylyltransferase MobA [Teichococcus vastitatis]|uniref:Molybdenum cofactor guanylyltransferase n=1 Tax=Teichococcus vastitatis TaxID=2307076 RepID=A0ABS9WBU9_9PROT|nr:molybdenum cofactor guanylyltransferase MobA [Pseudoroseomonas vastitatis]MCI0756473.1 molybdenum cofactor guanylyltransferase MobA [Pseudoroseomonas vastitatis]